MSNQASAQAVEPDKFFPEETYKAAEAELVVLRGARIFKWPLSVSKEKRLSEINELEKVTIELEAAESFWSEQQETLYSRIVEAVQMRPRKRDSRELL